MPKPPIIDLGESTDDDLTNLFSRSVRRNSRPQRRRPPSPFEGFLSRQAWMEDNAKNVNSHTEVTHRPLFFVDKASGRRVLAIPGNFATMDRGRFRPSFRTREIGRLQKAVAEGLAFQEAKHRAVSDMWQSMELDKHLQSPTPARHRPSRFLRAAKLISKVIK
jgi:hypothetical protein